MVAPPVDLDSRRGVLVFLHLFSGAATVVAWVFAAAVAITAGQRIADGVGILGPIGRS